MRVCLRLIVAIAMMIAAGSAQAQLYIVDDNFSDSAQVYMPEWNKDHTCEMPGIPVFKLPMGDTVYVERTLEGNSSYGMVLIDGNRYVMGSGELLFSDENPDGAEDVFGNTRQRTNHSMQGKFFATMIPYWVIALLFVGAMVFTWLGFKADALRPVALVVVPAALLAASMLEIWAYSVLGTSAFWWCDSERYGFFGSLFRFIPFAAFVAFQFYSIKWYMRLITGDEDNGLSIKPMLISIGICVPVALIVMFVCAGCFDLKSPWTEILFISTFLISLGVGLFTSARRNISELGRTAGMAFTLFGIAWSVGAIVAVVGLIIVVFKLIFQILIVVAAVCSLAFAMDSGKSTQQASSQMMFRDDDGRMHTNGVDRDKANERIRERRENY